VKGIDRTLPGANFPSSIVMFIRLLGLTLGMPVEVILLDWTKSNYSQSRAVLEQAFTAFRKWQKLLEDRFHRRVYRMAVDMAVARRVVTRRPDMYAHDWIKPTFPWIDQLAEAQAWGAKLDRNLCTLSQALKSLGKELDDELPARKAEIVKAIKTRDEIFAETGELIDWHPLAGYASSVNPLAEQQDDADDSKAQKDGEKPAAKQLTVFELAALQAASANPSVGNRGPVTIVIKQPRGPIKTVTRVLERNKKGGGDVVEQSHTYGQDEESRGSVTTVEPLPAREPAREVKAVAKGEVA
jgi:hypothetical protein